MKIIRYFNNSSSRQTMPKIYEIWPARNRFLCGCCITGPIGDVQGMLCIWCCSLAILIPFCIFVAGENLNTAPALPIIFFISIIAMFFFLYLTACTDPGIIPKKPFLERSPDEFKRFLIPPEGVQARICQSCHIIRPTKASHCSACQNCVEIFDHHCGFVGTCIAKRNYRYFIMFLASVVTSIGLCLINMVVFIISKSSSSVNQTAIIIIVAIVAALLGIPLIGFFIFHLYLACTRNTTREVLKKIERKQNEEVENQWCDVDPSNINFYQDIGEEEAESIKMKLQEMKKPLVRESKKEVHPEPEEERPQETVSKEIKSKSQFEIVGNKSENPLIS